VALLRVASDWHLGPRSPAAHGRLALRFLEAARADGAEVILNGDVWEELFAGPGAGHRAFPEVAAAAAALWCLLPAHAVAPAQFAACYAVAIAAGVISHVPGGLGVFEAVMLYAVGGHATTAHVLGALLLYRAVYYLLPLLLAVEVVPDIFRTVSNVTADVAVAAIVERGEQRAG